MKTITKTTAKVDQNLEEEMTTFNKLLASSANKINNYATAKERLKTIQDKIKKDVENDW